MTSSPSMGSAERLGELDILRGFALLGVFIVHFVGAGFYELPLGDAQREIFRESSANQAALFITEYFFYDKANTLFATLFGMGFWVMMERLEARGANFQKIYLRRLLALLAIGCINVFLIFPGDVLHEYAALGFVLFFLRKMPLYLFVIGGLALAIGGFFIADYLIPHADAAYEQFLIVQAAAFENGSYLNWVATTAPAHVAREFLGGVLLGWALYIFGRFLLGAWIIRQGWIQRSQELLPKFKKLLWVVLPIGLAMEGASLAVYMEWLSGPERFEDLLHTIGVLFLAAGYSLVLIVLFHSRFRSLAAAFAPVGRMALTAYVLHGAIFTMLYFPFGLDMLGQVSPLVALLFSVALYVAMTLAAHWWLARYRYGPLEYLWRWATYGQKPKFLLKPKPALA